jgi:hypothetical protein
MVEATGYREAVEVLETPVGEEGGVDDIHLCVFIDEDVDDVDRQWLGRFVTALDQNRHFRYLCQWCV